jgi:ribosomal protein L32
MIDLEIARKYLGQDDMIGDSGRRWFRAKLRAMLECPERGRHIRRGRRCKACGRFVRLNATENPATKPSRG